MICKKCLSARILNFSAKCSDSFFMTLNNKSKNDYVPRDMGIGGGDYIKMNLCLDCGTVQGSFPLEITEFENDSEILEE